MENLHNSPALDRFVVEFKTGQVIFCEYEKGSEFYMLKSGRVKLMRVMGKIEKTIGILEGGSFFGEMALLSDSPRSVTAIALAPTVLLAFNKQNFDMLIKSNPMISTKLLNMFAERIYEQKRQMTILKISDENIRVAEILIMLSEDTTPLEDTYKYVLPINLESVANWAGISTESAHKILQIYVNQNKIELYPDQIVVNNMNDFVRMVKHSKI